MIFTSTFGTFAAYFATDEEAYNNLMMLSSSRSTICSNIVKENMGTYTDVMLIDHISMSGTQNDKIASTNVVITGTSSQKKSSYAETAVYNTNGVHFGSAYKAGTTLTSNAIAKVNVSSISVKSVLHIGKQEQMCEGDKVHNCLVYKNSR